MWEEGAENLIMAIGIGAGGGFGLYRGLDRLARMIIENREAIYKLSDQLTRVGTHVEILKDRSDREVE